MPDFWPSLVPFHSAPYISQDKHRGGCATKNQCSVHAGSKWFCLCNAQDKDTEVVVIITDVKTASETAGQREAEKGYQCGDVIVGTSSWRLFGVVQLLHGRRERQGTHTALTSNDDLIPG